MVEAKKKRSRRHSLILRRVGVVRNPFCQEKRRDCKQSQTSETQATGCRNTRYTVVCQGGRRFEPSPPPPHTHAITVKPLLSGHLRDLPKCPLNRGFTVFVGTKLSFLVKKDDRYYYYHSSDVMSNL